jgi:DNA uptake protein ComE-like DNA-binding protein
MLEAIQDNIYINPEAIQKLNINTATFKDLIRHPYLTKDKVIRILDYLKVMKKINNLEELVKNKILDANDYEKLKWYFSFD